MFSLLRTAGAATLVGCSVATLMFACGGNNLLNPEPPDPALVAQGKDIFRFDTYGDETFWTDTLRMHEVIQTAVDPTTALAVVSRSMPTPFPLKWCRGFRAVPSA